MRNIKRQGLPATADTNVKSGRLKNILYHPTSGSSPFLSLFVGGRHGSKFLRNIFNNFLKMQFFYNIYKKSLLIVQFW